MKPKVFICLVFIMAVILAGCDQKQKSPLEEDAICPPQYLQVPMFVAPPDHSYVTAPIAMLQWSSPPVPYPYSADGTCRPENFRLTLQKGPFFQESFGGQVDGKVFSWETPPLENGAEYRWSVRAVTDNVNGPWSGSRTFFVGANCESGVTAPTLLMPFNGATIFGLTPTFMWQNTSECLPYPWRLEIATDPQFSDMVLVKDLDSAATTYTVETPLPNCTRYYWRIAASAGTDLQTYSDTWSVRLATEGCEAEPGAGSIHGKIWQDLCPLPHDTPTPGELPFGCIQHTNGAMADGNITPGESGIGEAIVHVARGTCTENVPLGVTKTNENGDYYLPGLMEGTYCISVDPAENPLWLGSGWWTYPPQSVDQTIGAQVVVLASDEDHSAVNFGWQRENGGANSYAFFGGIVFHDKCAVVPGSEVPDPLPAGCLNWFTGSEDVQVRANGYLEEGETGIPGITVELYKDFCQGPLYAETTTDEQGKFTFLVEPHQEYCLKVRAEIDPNMGILLPGHWSVYPNNPNWSLVTTFPAEYLNPDRVQIGWDFANQPLVISEIGDIFRYPKFKVDLEQANCRAGPDTLWQVYAKLLPGMEFEIKGVTREHDWLFITPSEILNRADFPLASFYEGLNCWVLNSLGTVEGDLDDVKIINRPVYATPTPTPAPFNCSDFKTDGQCGQHPDECYWQPAIPGIMEEGCKPD
jgi:hypothetical protein